MCRLCLCGKAGWHVRSAFPVKQSGVDVSNVRRVLGQSGTTVIVVDAEGENIIVYSPGSNAQVTVDYVRSMKD